MKDTEFINSIGLKMLPVPAGQFTMGEMDEDEVEWDEVPLRKITLSSFSMGATQITNKMYEEFDPEHKKYRGRRGVSSEDEESVVFVNWDDARAFCKWLSKKEGKTYRLPTEAEWEYAARAGTTDCYWPGELLPPEFEKFQSRRPAWNELPEGTIFSVRVGENPANAWGIYDMHGNVEDWCLDWYDLYPEGEFENPIGPETGVARVTRGGSFGVETHFLRSATRFAAIPEDRSWIMGFRIVLAPYPSSQHTPTVFNSSQYTVAVAQSESDWKIDQPVNNPLFLSPIPYVRPTKSEKVQGRPWMHHNHCPSITWCPNGDLLAIWFSTFSEWGRELCILASRLRKNTQEWEPASLFFRIPGRNLTGSALLTLSDNSLLHMNGMELAGSWDNLVLVARKSTDNGATWSKPSIVSPEHTFGNQVISGTIQLKDGMIVQPCDAHPSEKGGTLLHFSSDMGKTWNAPSFNETAVEFSKEKAGAWIAGIHAGVVELKNGSLLAFGRQNSIDEMMAQSISHDKGLSWNYSASPFPPIGMGQRLILIRLKEGVILFVSFTDVRYSHRVTKPEGWPFGLNMWTAKKSQKTCYGLFTAISFDEGETWPIQRLLGDASGQKLDSGDMEGEFLMDETHGEMAGYLAGTQGPNGIIHIITSNLHYRINFDWLKEPQSWK